MTEADEHTINDIVENMASKLYFHGHPINRQEAKNDLRLKVVSELTPQLESAMWDLYKEYEEDFQNLDTFNPAGDLAQAPLQNVQPANLPTKEYELLHAVVESARMSSKMTTKRRFTLLGFQAGQPAIREDILSQGWNHSQVPSAGTQPQP